MVRRNFLIEKHDYLAMFTIKHRPPYKSDVKGYNAAWLHTCFQTTGTIYLNYKGSHDSQLNKMG